MMSLSVLFLGLLTLFSLVVVFSYPGGLISVEYRDIKNHQFRMITGTVALGLLMVLYVTNFLFDIVPYDGLYQGAYGLLRWLTLGLGTSGLLLSGLAIWAMWETAWDLHRRAGMFGFLSGTVAGITGLISLVMLVW